MDQNTVLKLVKSNKVHSIIDSNLQELLTVLSQVNIEDIEQENAQQTLDIVIGTLTEKNNDYLKLIIAAIKNMGKTLDYMIPVPSILLVTQHLKTQDKDAQLAMLEVLNKADNLIAEANAIADKITPVLLEVIDSENYYTDAVSSEAIEILGSLTAYSLPPSFMNALEDAEIMDNAAITAACNAPSYSSEDRNKLLQKITDNLDITTGKTHAHLLMATLLLVEEGQPQLFESFRKISGDNKARVLQQLKDASPFLPIHESILLYSINDSHEKVLKYADEILDSQGKNPHKQHVDKVETWGDFYDFVQLMLKDRREIYKKPLSDYLKSALYTLESYKDKDLQISDVARILQDAFSKPPVKYNKDWEDLPEAEEDTYQEVEHLLQQQIVDLHHLQKDGLLENIDEDGVEAPSGNHWQNTDLFTYLELGTNGHEQSSLKECRWDELSNIFLMGSISE
ncbi:hypothetical protein [Candidatus Uabimicrobium amorphum]|uniref:Uncharacterized protein n=1 Tax=Uabimicrobium amorphum TaxID=2596890 RepID=A0A5S9IPQ2_UABAM|nr:hypothetical protein [Candidatus Uabimicrobium amorphum]BBM85427.1 hypothetical protein UABAM_03794 [Candidatus Uabimicrobium amorphum]